MWYFIIVLSEVVSDEAEWPVIGQPDELWIQGFAWDHFHIAVAQTEHLWLVAVAQGGVSNSKILEKAL
jgi:hypothetical protein